MGLQASEPRPVRRTGIGSVSPIRSVVTVRRRHGRPGQAAPGQADAPVALFAGDLEQILLCRRMRAAGRLSGGGDADHRHLAAAARRCRTATAACEWPCSTSSAPCLANVFWKRPMPNSRLCCATAPRTGGWWIMIDAEQALLRRSSSSSAPSRSAWPSRKEAVGHERRRGARRRDADQRDIAPDAHIGKGVAVGRRVDARRRSSRPPRSGRPCRRRPAHRRRDCRAPPTRHAASPASPATCLAISISPSSARLTRSPVTASDRARSP